MSSVSETGVTGYVNPYMSSKVPPVESDPVSYATAKQNRVFIYSGDVLENLYQVEDDWDLKLLTNQYNVKDTQS